MDNPGFPHDKIAVLIPDTHTSQLFSAADRQRLNQLGTVTWYAGEKAPTVEQAKDLLVDCDIASAVGGRRTPAPMACLRCVLSSACGSTWRAA